jgi:hypothetical protein
VRILTATERGFPEPPGAHQNAPATYPGTPCASFENGKKRCHFFCWRPSNVRKVPERDIDRHYSITSSAVARRGGGISRPRALAVFVLTTSLNFAGL